MGIFADFRAYTSIDLTPPVTGNMRVVSNDIDRLEAQLGDVDTPTAFVGRAPGLAILYVSGVIAGAPPVGTGDVEGVLNRGNNAIAPKEVTIRALAADAAIVEGNTLLEEGILNAVKYPNTPHVSQTFPVENRGPIVNYNGDVNGGIWASTGPYNPGENFAISPDLILSDPDITGDALDIAICELDLTFQQSGGGAPWVNAPNAAAAGVTFTKGSATGSTVGWTMQGTLNQLNAAVVGLHVWIDGFFDNQFKAWFRMSDLGNAGTGGAKLSTPGYFQWEIL